MTKSLFIKYCLVYLLILSCGSGSTEITREDFPKSKNKQEIHDTINSLSEGISVSDINKRKNEKFDSSKINFSNSFIDYCHELDDKYSNDTSIVKIKTWWDKKIEHLIKYSPANTFFSQSTTGPNGAEWNTMTDLYYAAFFPLDALKFIDDDVSAKIYLNNKLFGTKSKRIQFFEQGVLVDFHIKSELWINSLRKISPNDYSCLYSENDLNLHYSGKREFMAPLDIGNMFKVDVVLKVIDSKIKETDCFHIAFASC